MPSNALVLLSGFMISAFVKSLTKSLQDQTTRIALGTLSSATKFPAPSKFFMALGRETFCFWVGLLYNGFTQRPLVKNSLNLRLRCKITRVSFGNCVLNFTDLPIIGIHVSANYFRSQKRFTAMRRLSQSWANRLGLALTATSNLSVKIARITFSFDWTVYKFAANKPD